VPARGQQIDVKRCDINWHVAECLRCIHQNLCARRPGNGGDLSNRLNCPSDVRGVRRRDQPRVRPKGPFDILRVDKPGAVGGDIVDLHVAMPACRS
jgi:hypothetical protein